MNRSRRTGIFLAFFLGVSWGAFGQVSGALSGTVRDASGTGIGGAKVTIRDLETGATRVVATDEAGHYSALGLGVGEHEVKVEKNGFKLAVHSGIHLEVGQTAVVDFKLEVGELVQEVTVTADAPIVNTTTSAVSGVV